MTRANSPVAAVVLAAGRGKRFPGVASKVLVPLGGRPLVHRVLDAVVALAPDRVIVVVGHGKQEVQRAVAGYGVETVDQGEPRGTGHALLAAAELLGATPSEVLVLNGDVPLLQARTLLRLLQTLREREASCVLLSAVLEDPQAYGRVIRAGDGSVASVVETADASPAEREVREVNVGAYAFAAPEVFEVLRGVGYDNAQGELYLTDAVRGLRSRGRRVEALVLADPLEAQGVNSPQELAGLEARMERLPAD